MAVRRSPRFDRSARWAAAFLLALPAGVGAQTPAALPDSWTATTRTGAPSGRHDHVAVSTGAKMIVWGGDSGLMEENATLGTGGVYDPVSNAWTETATVGAPAPRRAAAAVWTGSEMIVWGGLTFNTIPPTIFNNGGIYDPTTNSWRSVSTVGAPVARFAHTAVWTGSEMIVWGGYSHTFNFLPTGGVAGDAVRDPQAITIDLGPLNSGGIYNPATDTWRPVSTLNAPPPRGEHTAIWTGSRMIVWGGDGPQSNLAGGGIYDPVTDTWTPTSGIDEPSARDAHTAVWTGSRMVIWGGTGGMDNLRTGGVFDPVTNSWKPTSLTGSPSARELHVGVAIRGRMIVWGGSTSGDEINSGGIYDPETDTWTTTAISGAPSGRRQATAVSAGSAMIVWGGFDGDHDVNSGGIYTPPIVPCTASRGCVSEVPVPDAALVSGRP